jgi:hypothetical protein
MRTASGASATGWVAAAAAAEAPHEPYAVQGAAADLASLREAQRSRPTTQEMLATRAKSDVVRSTSGVRPSRAASLSNSLKNISIKLVGHLSNMHCYSSAAMRHEERRAREAAAITAKLTEAERQIAALNAASAQRAALQKQREARRNG